MNKESVAVIGSGGAESALVEAYSKSPHIGKIIVIPGNDMMPEINPSKEIFTYPNLKIDDPESIVDLLKNNQKVSYVDVRNEKAIESGLTNMLIRNGIRSCSPSKSAGKLESDKLYTRELGEELRILQPKFDSIDFKYGTPKYLDAVIERYKNLKVFLKATGLCDGKGVVGCDGVDEIYDALAFLRENFPEQSNKIIFEAGVTGQEVSAFAMVSGEEIRMIGFAQDHKQVFNDDKGPNTGGMGAINDPEVAREQVVKDEIQIVFEKFAKKMSEKNHTKYKGILFGGFMIGKSADMYLPYLLEFNARWGDPEAQVLVPGIEQDLFEINSDIANNSVPNEISLDKKKRISVAIVAKGYPGNYEYVRGKRISGITAAKKVKGVKLYGAGIKKIDTNYYADGGRILHIMGEGKDFEDAFDKAYEAINHIRINGLEGENLIHYRTDIGKRNVKY